MTTFDLSFVFSVLIVTLLVTSLYSISANATVFLSNRREMNSQILNLMWNYLTKIPFFGAAIGFLGGFIGYLVVSISNNYFSHAKRMDILTADTRLRIVLVVFIIFGFSYGTIRGLAIFIKEKKFMDYTRAKTMNPPMPKFRPGTATRTERPPTN